MRPEVLGAPDEVEREKRIGLFWTHIDKDVDHKVTLRELTKLTSKAIQHVTKGAPSWLVAGFMRVHGTSLGRSERTGWFEGPVWKGGIMLRALKNKGNARGGVTSPLRTIMANRVFQQTSNFFVLVAVGTFLAATATAHEKQRSFLLVIELVLFVFFFFEMVRVGVWERRCEATSRVGVPCLHVYFTLLTWLMVDGCSLFSLLCPFHASSLLPQHFLTPRL
jgi:hypothetical protein